MSAGLRGGGEVGVECRCTSGTIITESTHTGSHRPVEPETHQEITYTRAISSTGTQRSHLK